MTTERQYRGYHHPTTRDEMGMRPGEVQTKVFHKLQYPKKQSENFMSQEIKTLPLDGQPEIFDDVVYDTVDVKIKIQPLKPLISNTVSNVNPKSTPKQGEKLTALDTSNI